MAYSYDEYFGGEMSTATGETALIAILITLFVLFLILAVSLVFYLLNAFGIYRMAKTLGIANAGLAFVPIANKYILGKIAETPVGGKKPLRYSMILLLLTIASFVLGLAFCFYSIVFEVTALTESVEVFDQTMSYSGFAGFFIGYLATLAISITYSVFYYIALYKVFKLFAPDNAVVFLVLSILISGALPIILFIIRNKQPQVYVQGQIPPFGTPGYNPAFDQNNYDPYGYDQNNYSLSGAWNQPQNQDQSNDYLTQPTVPEEKNEIHFVDVDTAATETEATNTEIAETEAKTQNEAENPTPENNNGENT